MDQPPEVTTQTELSEEEVPSLDLMLEMARKRIDEENAQFSALDTKAGFVLGSASLLTAGVAAFQRTAFDVGIALLEQ